MEKQQATNPPQQQQNQDDDAEQTNDPALQKLSKAQRKKLKDKNKKAAEKEKAVNPTENTPAKVEGETQVKPDQNAEQKKPQEPKAQTKDAKKDKNKKGGKPMNAAALMAQKKLAQQQKFEQQQRQKIRLYELEQQRIRKEQEQKKRKEEEEKQKIRQEEEERIKIDKIKGLHMSKKQKQKLQRAREQLDAQKNAPEKTEEVLEPKEKSQQQLKIEKDKLKKKEDSSVLRDDRIYFERREGEFRSPICAILGHVDTGKTTLLDKIRRTNVQEGEAGGITQQIGATFFPLQKLTEEVTKCKEFLEVNLNVPGLMIIDTPGHESFSNLRSRGSSLCDIAILVIDLMHGLENQTLESLELLRKGNTPFVVALNKIDRCYGWESINDSPSFTALQRQKSETKHDFDTKFQKVIAELNVKGYNADLYWKVEDPDDYIPLVPTSGVTGEGIPDILSLLVKYATTIPRTVKKIKVKKDKFSCTVMEVKMTEGYGTTIDCILVDGKIKKDDQIVLLGFKGPIVTKVKAILTPHPMKQMRIKDEYLHHTEMHAANGVKLAAVGLDEAVAGTPLFVCKNQDEVEEAMIICNDEFDNIKKKIKLENLGVGVAASTLGSLEALLEYLSSQKVPVSYITVGPVSKDDVMKAMKSVLSEVPEKRKKQYLSFQCRYCCLLVFDVKVLHDAQQYAEQNSVKVFSADIIYHLMDMFTKYVEEVREERKLKEGKDAIFPCVLKQVATFRKNDPIVMGVDVEHGVLKVGTPITVYKKKNKGDKQKVRIGFVESIEHNHKKLKEARKETGSVAICIAGEPKIASGKDFEEKDLLVSMLSRRSIDSLKEHYRNEVKKQEWELIIELKPYFGL